MGIVVDKWGNVWDEDDTERVHPAMAHPELEGARKVCPRCKVHFAYRVKAPDGFAWKAGPCDQCQPDGVDLPDWHH